MLVIGDKIDNSEPASPEPEEHGIKCKYMRAAQGYLSNTTFHGIAWVVEDVPRATKVRILSSLDENREKCREV